MAIVLGIAGMYLVLSVVLWALQERITFPAPRSPLPDPVKTIGYGEQLELRMQDGTRLVGWYLPPAVERGTRPEKPQDCSGFTEMAKRLARSGRLFGISGHRTQRFWWSIIRDTEQAGAEPQKLV